MSIFAQRLVAVQMLPSCSECHGPMYMFTCFRLHIVVVFLLWIVVGSMFVCFRLSFQVFDQGIL